MNAPRTIGGRSVHWAAEIYPMMSADDRSELLASIERNGFKADRPVLVDESGTILDGRNRAEVCASIGIAPLFRTVTSNEIGPSVVEFVRSLNTRRNLTPSQRAVVAVNLEEGFAREAKERADAARRDGGKKGGRPPAETLSDEPSLKVRKQDNDARAATQAAKAAGAGIKSTEALKSVKKTAPEVFDAVRDGKLNVSQAKAIAKAPEQQRAAAVERIAHGEKPADVVRELPRVEPAKPRELKWDHDGEMIALNRLMNRIRIECPPDRREALSAFFAAWSRRLKEMDDVREAG